MKTVLVFGDSNTWGLIPGSDPAEQYPQDVRWTGRLQSACPDVRFWEEGLCGRTIAHEDADRPNRNGLDALRQLLNNRQPPDAAIV
ncbi:MAG: arylesterase, partial [Clostridia bacterium]|nr:arylesterase [Clostridia bacterium]